LVESSWNRIDNLAESFWMIRALARQGAQPLWKSVEGGGGPDQLGYNGACMTGCWYPVGIVEYDDQGNITKAYWMPKAANGTGYDYSSIQTMSQITPTAQPLMDALKLLEAAAVAAAA